jgi:phospholipid-binding lipoprotein MlaA
MEGFRLVDKRANLLRVGNVLEEAALDKYSFTRDAYLQRRRSEIHRPNDDDDVPPALPDESNEPPAQPQPASGGQPAVMPKR